MYPAAFVVATIYSLLFVRNSLAVTIEVLYVYAIGIIWVLGVYASMIATKINMSKFKSINAYKSVVTIILAIIFLNEFELLDPSSMEGGQNLAGVSLFVFALGLNLKLENDSKEANKVVLFGIIFALLHGIATFLVKIVVEDLEPSVILMHQYFISTIVMWLITIVRKIPIKLPRRQILFSWSAGFITFFALVTFYQALNIGPASIITPTRAILGTILGIAMGMIIFGERKLLDNKEKIAIAISIISLLLFVL
ncbi:EamA family transporter [Candidatus Dojkabacteria bacterium]|nr:EamA family transporter [Candidatus Dojkabacteria bacterium]